MAASANASFSSGKSFIAAQHPSEEEQALAEGPLFREDRSMTHEGILLHESPQVSPMYCLLMQQSYHQFPAASQLKHNSHVHTYDAAQLQIHGPQ